jgi:hypothetical protein
MDKLFSLFTSMTATRLFYERGPHETKWEKRPCCPIVRTRRQYASASVFLWWVIPTHPSPGQRKSSLNVCNTELRLPGILEKDVDILKDEKKMSNILYQIEVLVTW